jgi:hypothetical protein
MRQTSTHDIVHELLGNCVDVANMRQRTQVLKERASKEYIASEWQVCFKSLNGGV